MGNNPQKQSKNQFKMQQWDVIKKNKLKQSPFESVIYKHKKTQELIKKFIVIHRDEQQFNFYKAAFSWRNNMQNIVSSKYFQERQYGQFCTTIFAADLYLQHIPLLLNDIQILDLSQGMYLLYSALNGFQKLYKVVSYFKVQQNLVGINSEGILKVWVNKDHSKNYPQRTQTNVYKQFVPQNRMVDDIFKLVQRKFRKNELPITFQQYFRNKGIYEPIFQEAKNAIEDYCKQYNILIAKRLNFLTQLKKSTISTQKNSVSKQTVKKQKSSSRRKVKQTNENLSKTSYIRNHFIKRQNKGCENGTAGISIKQNINSAKKQISSSQKKNLVDYSQKKFLYYSPNKQNTFLTPTKAIITRQQSPSPQYYNNRQKIYSTVQSQSQYNCFSSIIKKKAHKVDEIHKAHPAKILNGAKNFITKSYFPTPSSYRTPTRANSEYIFSNQLIKRINNNTSKNVNTHTQYFKVQTKPQNFLSTRQNESTQRQSSQKQFFNQQSYKYFTINNKQSLDAQVASDLYKYQLTRGSV